MKSKSLAIAFSLAVPFLGSCVTDHAERVYITKPSLSTPADVLTVIPQKSYDVIADIQWQGGTIQKMASRAAQLGGDAVIIQLLGGNVHLTGLSPEEMNKENKTFNRMAGTVIKYRK
jgi:hypothetical protein